MARIYTRTGDDGTTELVGGQRVPKDSPLIEACGSLDELNAHIGAVRSCGLPDDVNAMLQNIQSALFTIGTQIATPEGSNIKIRGISDKEVGNLEHEIDTLENTLHPLRQFILPGGSSAASALHLARTVARRAERRCVTLARSRKIDPQVLRYLNRLSDLCFLLARYANQYQSVPELHPSIRTGS